MLTGKTPVGGGVKGEGGWGLFFSECNYSSCTLKILEKLLNKR